MDTAVLLELVKLKLGISTELRDKPLTKIIDGVLSELQNELGITIQANRPDHELFVVDLAAHRYESKSEALPRHLQWRLHNLQLGSKKEAKDVEQ